MGKGKSPKNPKPAPAPAPQVTPEDDAVRSQQQATYDRLKRRKGRGSTLLTGDNPAGMAAGGGTAQGGKTLLGQ